MLENRKYSFPPTGFENAFADGSSDVSRILLSAVTFFSFSLSPSPFVPIKQSIRRTRRNVTPSSPEPGFWISLAQEQTEVKRFTKSLDMRIALAEDRPHSRKALFAHTHFSTEFSLPQNATAYYYLLVSMSKMLCGNDDHSDKSVALTVPVTLS